MRLISVEDLTPGMVIARSIYDDNYRLLVSGGVALDARIIDRLKKQGFFQVYIEEPGTEEIIPPELVSEKVRSHTSRILNRSFDIIRTATEIKQATVADVNKLLDEGKQFRNVVNVVEIRTVIKSILEDLFTNNVALFEAPLFRGYLGRHYEHSLNTTILSVLIGKQYRFDLPDLTVLGMGALLHDIGKMFVPSVLDKPQNQHTEEEVELMKQHPLLGAKLLSKVPQVSFAEIASVEQHHENQDGSGYPRGLKGTNSEPFKHRPRQPGRIFRMAEILAVANTFDNLVDPTVTRPPFSPVDAVEQIITQGGTRLNSHIVGNAVNVINVFPVGATIRVKVHPDQELEDAGGVVFRANKDDPGRPWVMLLHNKKGRRFPQPVVINLLDHKSVKIVLK